jgi:hypothetical protein
MTFTGYTDPEGTQSMRPPREVWAEAKAETEEEKRFGRGIQAAVTCAIANGSGRR